MTTSFDDILPFSHYGQGISTASIGTVVAQIDIEPVFDNHIINTKTLQIFFRETSFGGQNILNVLNQSRIKSIVIRRIITRGKRRERLLIILNDFLIIFFVLRGLIRQNMESQN